MSGTKVEGSSIDERKDLIAPVWHTIVLLLLLSIPIALGVLRLVNNSTAPPETGPMHPANLWKFYAQTLIYEWILVGVVWVGIRLKQIKLKELIGGRWPTIGHAFADLIIGAAICVTMFYIGDELGAWLKPANGNGNSINVVPQDGLEMALWVALSATAGVVEEIVFRGYLQTQFVRFGMPLILAILAQTFVFAVGHIYEGLFSVTVIAVYGALLGLLAAGLKSLRPLIIGHVMYDVIAVLRAT